MPSTGLTKRVRSDPIVYKSEMVIRLVPRSAIDGMVQAPRTTLPKLGQQNTDMLDATHELSTQLDRTTKLCVT
jgi:hypothetical protein